MLALCLLLLLRAALDLCFLFRRRRVWLFAVLRLLRLCRAFRLGGNLKFHRIVVVPVLHVDIHYFIKRFCAGVIRVVRV